MKRSGLGCVCERFFTYLDIIIDCVAGEVRLRPPVVEVCAVHKAPRALQRSPICATGRGVLSVVPTPACLMGTGNARGGRGSRKAGELATEGRRGGESAWSERGQGGRWACAPAWPQLQAGAAVSCPMIRGQDEPIPAFESQPAHIKRELGEGRDASAARRACASGNESGRACRRAAMPEAARPALRIGLPRHVGRCSGRRTSLLGSLRSLSADKKFAGRFLGFWTHHRVYRRSVPHGLRSGI